MNKTIIIGRIGADAVARKATSGATAIGFNVAVSKKVKELYETTWFKCTKWVQAGATSKLDQFIKKGGLIMCEGEIGTDLYADKVSLTLNVVNVEFLEKAKEAAPVTENPEANTNGLPPDEYPDKVAAQDGAGIEGDDLPF